MLNSPNSKSIEWKKISDEEAKLASLYSNRINTLKKQRQELLNSYSLLEEEIKRKQKTQQVLLATKTNLKKLLNYSPSVVYSRQADHNFGITFVSDSIKQFGYQPNDFLQNEESWKEYIHPTDLENITQKLSLLNSGQKIVTEYRFVLPDASCCWIQDQFNLVYDSNGKAIEIIGSWHNISDRKKFEEQLFQEKELAQTTLESIGEAVITTDSQGNIQYLNPVAQKITGWTIEEAKNLYFTTVFKTHVQSSTQIVSEVIEDALKEGKTISGECVLTNRDGQKYCIHKSIAPIRDKEQKNIGMVIIFQDMSQKHQLSEQLFWQANYDSLTGLMNRYYFEDNLQKAVVSCQAKNICHSLLYLDLDCFKIVNDTCGHHAGDELLKQLGEVLQSKIRPQDMIARLGGDEFGILLKRADSVFAQTFAEQIRCAVEKFVFLWNDNSFHVGVSIGLITMNRIFTPAQNILSLVDNACYVAKNNGRNRVYACQLNDRQLLQERKQTEWIIKIERALKENRFCLYKQAIVSLNSKNGQAEKHYEILLRMVDNDQQVIAPMAFIPSAERYGLMPKIDRWVIEYFCSVYKNLYISDSRFFAINLSGASINDEFLFDFIQKQINTYQIPANKLCFEITETVTIANLTKASKLISQLKQLGCFIALDDFGSGMSSFGYLKNFPCDYLKIDGNFVKDIVTDATDEVMVDCINRMAKVMGIKTIAEYVENNAIKNKLIDLGINYGQGYGIDIPEILC